MNRYLALFIVLLSSFFARSQEYSPQMADTFREEGKIYVVITVIAIIFVSLLFFLIHLERKLSRIEKEIRRTTRTEPTDK